MLAPHKIALAMRCQLVTGSYSGATRSCSCKTPGDCQLADCERSEAEKHPLVKNALERNKEEYRNIRGKKYENRQVDQ